MKRRKVRFAQSRGWFACTDTCSASGTDPYEAHFGLSPSGLTEEAREAVGQKSWSTRREKCGRLGPVVESLPEGSVSTNTANAKHMVCAHIDLSEKGMPNYVSYQIPEKMREPLQKRQAKLPRGEFILSEQPCIMLTVL